MLERIRVKGFKSLDDVEVELRPLVVLLGPNTAGKSNFLESLLLLSRCVTQRTLHDAFSDPLRGWPLESFRLPETGLPGLLRQADVKLSLEADLLPSRATNGVPERLRYRVGISITPKTGALSVTDEYLARLTREGKERQSFKPRIERDESLPGAPRLVIRKLSEAGHPVYEELGLNHTLVSNLQYSGDGRYPDFDRIREEMDAWRMYYLEPRDLMRQPQPPRDVTDIGARGEALAPFLYRLKTSNGHVKNFEAVVRALTSSIPSIEKLDVELDEKKGVVDIAVTQDGVPYSLRVLSEGTLRVLALCALAANPWPSPLMAFEEPENGVHPRRVDVMARLLQAMSKGQNRQVIVTTHSPQLVAALVKMRRDEELQDLDVCFLRCAQSAGGSRIQSMGPVLPLFDEQDIQEALKADDDARILDAMLMRGWLDG